MSDFLEVALILSAVNQASAPLKQVQGDLGQVATATQKLQGAGQQLAITGAAMTAAGEKINGALKEIVLPAAEVEDALARVGTVVTPMEGSVTDALARVKQAGLEWSDQHKNSASEFISTTYEMISANLNEKAAIDATRTAMLLATATGGELNETASNLATIYNEMGDATVDSAKELERIGDVLGRTQQKFQLSNLGQLTEGLKYGMPVAKTYGMGLEELNVIIGQLNSSGLKGSQAGTSFAATMRDLSGASKTLGFEIARTEDGGVDFIGTMANLEKQFGSLQDMTPEMVDEFKSAFSDEGFRSVAIMMGKTQQLRGALDDVTNSTFTVAEAAERIESTSRGQWQVMMNQLENIKGILGESLTPAFQKVTPYIREAGEGFKSWVEAHPDLVRTVLIIAAVIGGVLAIFGPIIMVVGSLMMFGAHAWIAAKAIGAAFLWIAKTAIPVLFRLIFMSLKWALILLANPITWIVLAVVAAVYLIYRYWEPITQFFSGLWAEIKGAFDQGFIQGIMKVLEMLNPLSHIMRAFDAVTQWLFGFSLYDAGANILRSLWDGMKSLASKPAELMKGVVQKVRNLLPFSPAKEGPLRDLHKVRLIETVADGVSAAPLVDAMSGAAAAAMASLPKEPLGPTVTFPGGQMQFPVMASMPRVLPQLGQGQGPQTPIVQHNTFNVGRSEDKSLVDELEEWLADPLNAERLFMAVQKRKEQRDRRRFE